MLQGDRILLVINPISGSVDKEDFIKMVGEEVGKTGAECLTYSTTGQNDVAAIRDIVSESKPSRILVAGGDGTIVMVAEAIEGLEVVLGLLPMGSANGLTTSLNIPNDPEIALDIALGDHFAVIDGVRINSEISLHLSDLGLNALLVKHYEEGELRGKLGYAKEVVKTLSTYEPFHVRIKMEEEEFESEAVIVIIANAQKYGTGVAINPFGDLSDGKFEIVVARRVDVIELTKLLAGSTEFDPEVVSIFSVTAAEIECLDKGTHFQIDGEYKGIANYINPQIIAGMLKVAVPEKTVD